MGRDGDNTALRVGTDVDAVEGVMKLTKRRGGVGLTSFVRV